MARNPASVAIGLLLGLFVSHLWLLSGGNGGWIRTTPTNIVQTTVLDNIVEPNNNRGVSAFEIGSRVHLSVVFTVRNDNYVGQTARTKNAVCILYHQLAQFASAERQAEIVLVEWNPIPDRRSSSAFLSLEECKLKQSSRHVQVRTIVVPSNVTQDPQRNPSGWVFMEFIAKNVGIRRAKGTWILGTNPDDLFPLELVKVMMVGHLNPSYFYRTRLTWMDLRISPGTAWWERNQGLTPIELSNTSTLTEIRNWLASDNSTFRFPKSYASYFAGLCENVLAEKSSEEYFSAIQGSISTRDGAAGDFTLATKKAWFAVSGYPEVPTLNLDGTVLKMFVYQGFRQVDLPYPCGTSFHQQHESGRKGLGIQSNHGRNDFQRCLDDYNKVNFTTMASKPWDNCLTTLFGKVGQPDWGMGNLTFEDFVVGME